MADKTTQGEKTQETSKAEDTPAEKECEEKLNENNSSSDPAAAEKLKTSEDNEESRVDSFDPDDMLMSPLLEDTQTRIEKLKEKQSAESYEREKEQRATEKAAYEFSSDKVFRGKFLEPIRDDKGDIIGYKNPLHIGHLDLKVGQVLRVGGHPQQSKQCRFTEVIAINPHEKLPSYFFGSSKDIEKIREERELVVESGLPRKYALDDLARYKIVVLCNPKPFKSRGVESKVVVLCAKKGKEIELLQAPHNATVGQSIVAKGYPRNPQKPYVVNVTEHVIVDLRVNEDKQVVYKDKPLTVDGTQEYITTRNLSDCGVSNVMGYDFI